MTPELRVLIAVPTAGMVSVDAAYSWLQLGTRMQTHGIATRGESKVTVAWEVIKSSVIVSNREKLAKAAVVGGYSHLMFVDDDMAFAPEILEIMLGRRHSVVLTNYLIKGETPQFTAIGHGGRRVPTMAQSTGLESILYSGFGVSLIETRVFRDIEQPWFQAEYDPEQSAYTTEDFSFFERVRKAGYEVLLDHDASKLVAHVGRKAWKYDEYKPEPLQLVEGNKDGYPRNTLQQEAS